MHLVARRTQGVDSRRFLLHVPRLHTARDKRKLVFPRRPRRENRRDIARAHLVAHFPRPHRLGTRAQQLLLRRHHLQPRLRRRRLQPPHLHPPRLRPGRPRPHTRVRRHERLLVARGHHPRGVGHPPAPPLLQLRARHGLSAAAARRPLPAGRGRVHAQR